MISQTKIPTSKSELVKGLSNLPHSTKFDVIEVFSNKDKLTVNRTFDKFLRKGSFTVIVVEGN